MTISLIHIFSFINGALLSLVLFFVYRLVKKTDMLHEKVIKLDTLSEIINIQAINSLREELGVMKRNQDTLFRFYDDVKKECAQLRE